MRAISPVGKNDIVWKAQPDTRTYGPYRPWLPYGSALSASAEATTFLYCHDYADGSALCSTIFDVMSIGNVLTIETGSAEQLSYRLESKLIIPKGDVASFEPLRQNIPGRLVIITCYSDGVRDAQGVVIENSVLVLQLVQPSPLDPRVAERIA